MPNVLCDFHEMNQFDLLFSLVNLQEPIHWLLSWIKIDDENRSYAKALDKIGSSYFIEENWWFYYGKFVLPDINGSVGILFEQASSRGHAQESANGIVTFRLRLKPIHY
jgi:hypothetical protein